jgi:hypothetical protein
MIGPLLETLALLLVIGILPASSLARLRPVTVFLAPLLGALLAAFSAELELAIGGSLLNWFVPLAAVSNVAAILWLLSPPSRARRAVVAAGRSEGTRRKADPILWQIVTFLVIGAAAFWSLWALRAPVIGFDANAIWEVHALLIYAGHTTMLNALHNPVYGLANMDYPPLVPAGSSLAFYVKGSADLDLGVAVTTALSACGLGVVGCGIANVPGPNPKVRARLVALMAGAAACLIGFGVAGSSGVSGFADLAWTAPAVGAVVFGLALPRSTQNLAVAWLCATAAGLTKNEGFTTALVILILIAIRYGTRGSTQSSWRYWGGRAVWALLMVLPAATWSVLIRLYGVKSDFFAPGRAESVGYRMGPTISGMASYLGIVPVAGVVLILGVLFLSSRRKSMGLAGPGWLWGVTIAYLLILFATYIAGSPEIHWWLGASTNRTTIFPRVALYTDLSLWVAVAASSDRSSDKSPARADSTPIPAEAEERAQPVRSLA